VFDARLGRQVQGCNARRNTARVDDNRGNRPNIFHSRAVFVADVTMDTWHHEETLRYMVVESQISLKRPGRERVFSQRKLFFSTDVDFQSHVPSASVVPNAQQCAIFCGHTHFHIWLELFVNKKLTAVAI
jgi:hypothetical protein